MNDAVRKRLAEHEASHAVVGELLGWRVRALCIAPRSAVCMFRNLPPSPLVEIIVSVAGPAIEHELYRDGGDGGSADRLEAAVCFVTAGLSVRDAASAVAQVEREVWPVFGIKTIRNAVRRVARQLTVSGVMTRKEFLAVADLGEAARARRLLRRYATRLVLRVHAEAEQ